MSQGIGRGGGQPPIAFATGSQQAQGYFRKLEGASLHLANVAMVYSDGVDFRLDEATIWRRLHGARVIGFGCSEWDDERNTYDRTLFTMVSSVALRQRSGLVLFAPNAHVLKHEYYAPAREGVRLIVLEEDPADHKWLAEVFPNATVKRGGDEEANLLLVGRAIYSLTRERVA